MSEKFASKDAKGVVGHSLVGQNLMVTGEEGGALCPCGEIASWHFIKLNVIIAIMNVTYRRRRRRMVSEFGVDR